MGQYLKMQEVKKELSEYFDSITDTILQKGDQFFYRKVDKSVKKR